MAVCQTCGKGTVVGRSQQHRRGVAGKRWKRKTQSTRRLFKPNLQKTTVIENGEEVSKVLCSKCIKRLKKDKKLKYQQIQPQL